MPISARNMCNNDYNAMCTNVNGYTITCGNSMAINCPSSLGTVQAQCETDYTNACTNIVNPNNGSIPEERSYAFDFGFPAAQVTESGDLNSNLTTLNKTVFNKAVGIIVPSIERRLNYTLSDAGVTLPTTAAAPTVTSPTSRIRPMVLTPQGNNFTAPNSGSALSMSMQMSPTPYSDLPRLANTVRTTQKIVKINIRPSCFPTNLRVVQNGVSPNAIISLKGKYSINSSVDKDFKISFPAKNILLGHEDALAVPLDPTMLVGFEDYPNSLAFSAAQLISARIPVSSISSVDLTSGQITQAQNTFKIKDLSFEQKVPEVTAQDLIEMTKIEKYQAAAATYMAVTGASYYWITYPEWKQSIINHAYMGQTGPITGYSLDVNQSADGQSYDILSSLPGDITMCGGFYSPLMVFFDQERPHFENISNFKMKHDYPTYWPEVKHSGYFIGLLNPSGKIESYKDLFSETELFKNGFEALAQYDLNKDGVIDKKDPVFKKLVLWKDSTGKGQFTKKDILKLSHKIKSIDLNYKDIFEMAGTGAEYRQRSQFTFIKKNKAVKGEIVDVWFKPYLKKQVILTAEK